ncbi:MAG TPA: hypothetical protein VIE89_25775 [Candidatus Binatia bacterium]
MKSGFDALGKHYAQLRSNVKAAHLGAILPLAKGLREFFQTQISLEQAEEEIRRALCSREAGFLQLVRTQVFGRPNSPYLKLLRMAGCEFADLETCVHRRGLEKTLEKLSEEGVYLTSDEFKGKKEVIRQGGSFWVSPKDFECFDAAPGFAIESSGTRNRPVGSFIALDWLAVRALAMRVFLAAHDLFSASHALYDAILPGSGVNHLLINAKLARPTDRWFAREIPFNTSFAGVYHKLTTSLIVFMGKWFGPGLPRPEFIDIQALDSIVRWIEQKRLEGKNCQVTTIVSSAVRIAQAALRMGVPLEGTKFVVSGEPYTDAKRNKIEQAGARAVSHYAYGGGMNVGFGCANPAHVDEIHVNQHMFGVIAHPRSLTDGPIIHPLLCTTLHPAAPRLLLNVENGDYVTLATRDCGCTLGKVGLTLHLSHIRSFEKFTSEGMNYFYGDLFELLERVLPAEFGGGPGDYQLLEEEDKTSQTRLSLLVHPAVPKLNEDKLLSRLQQGLEENSNGNRFMPKVWQDAGILRIRREIPYSSPRGKILPLHIRH